jgi:hypothetical protein
VKSADLTRRERDVDIYRIRDGRISEEWAADDIAAIMSQLGAFSPPRLG